MNRQRATIEIIAPTINEAIEKGVMTYKGDIRHELRLSPKQDAG